MILQNQLEKWLFWYDLNGVLTKLIQSYCTKNPAKSQNTCTLTLVIGQRYLSEGPNIWTIGVILKHGT